MGLDISHDAFSGAYSAFNRFRKAVCEATGGHWCDEVSGYDMWFMGDGYDSDTHPGLFAFLINSDCGGEIASETAAALADELEALLPKLSGTGGGHLAARGGIAAVAEQLIVGCRKAAVAGENLEFR